MENELDLAAAALTLSLQATTALRRHRLLTAGECARSAEALEQLLDRLAALEPRDQEQRAQLDELRRLADYLRQDAAR